jgi:hypothetical protein
MFLLRQHKYKLLTRRVTPQASIKEVKICSLLDRSITTLKFLGSNPMCNATKRHPALGVFITMSRFTAAKNTQSTVVAQT